MMQKLLPLIAVLGLAACAAQPATLDIDNFVTPASKEFLFKSNGPEDIAVRWKGQTVALVKPGHSVTVELKP